MWNYWNPIKTDVLGVLGGCKKVNFLNPIKREFLQLLQTIKTGLLKTIFIDFIDPNKKGENGGFTYVVTVHL